MDIFTFLEEVIKYIYDVLLTVLTALVEFLITLVKLLLSFLRNEFDDLIHGRFLQMWNDFVKFINALNKLLAPFIQYYRRMQQLWHSLFFKYLGPVLQLLTSIRRVLALLRIFHIGWATKLDSYLAGIESKILGVYLRFLAQPYYFDEPPSLPGPPISLTVGDFSVRVP